MKQKEKEEQPKTKEAALSSAISSLEKEFGKGIIMTLDAEPQAVPRVSSDIFSFDYICGGGIPRGRIIEIYGPESGGKTTLSLQIEAAVQKIGGTAAFVDAEHALDLQWAKHIGINTETLLLSQPDYGEQALSVVETLVASNAVDIVVVDSVAALTPRSEIEGEMGDAQMASQARLMSQAMRKLTGIVAKSGCIVIFVNQIRNKVGIIYGNPEVTSGGNALKFYASLRIDVRKREQIKHGTEVVGVTAKIKCVKNKTAPPFRETEMDIVFGKGVSKAGDLVNSALMAGIIDKAGPWFSYKEEKIGQGLEATTETLEKDPILFQKIWNETLDAIKNVKTPEVNDQTGLNA